MTEKELTQAVQTTKDTTKQTLQTVYDALNSGQKKKILKNESVKGLFDLYGVETE